jgi:Glutamyl-tRNAGlu reductase, N-terminal domain
MKLFAAGISHKTAPVELRERLAVKQSEIADLAFVLKCFGHLDEIVLLSTCNRVEIYGTTRHATRHIKSLLQLLCAEPGALDPHIYLYEGAAAVRHLLRVTAGLDSMVLGETEITGQIKSAYEIAHNVGLTGPVLNRLSKGVSGDKRNSDAHRDRARHGFNQEHSSGIDWKDRSVAAIDHGTRRRRDGGELCSISRKKRRAIDLHFESFV